MPPFFSRFRRPSPASPPPNPPSISFSQQVAPANVISPLEKADLVPRKIHPDLDSLLQSFAADEDKPDVPAGLRPRTRRHSVDGSSHRDTQSRVRSQLNRREPVLEADETEGSQRPEDRSQRHSEDEHDVSNFSHPNIQWSTFGRHTEFISPHSDDPSSEPVIHDFASSSKRTRAVSRNSSIKSTSSNQHPSICSRRHSIQSHSTLSASPTNQSPENTLSSRKGSRTTERIPFTSSSQAQSQRSPKSHPARISASAAKDLGFDSPGTFGHPTPPSQSKPRGSPSSGYGHDSEPPPLPPLDHPAFATFSRSYVRNLHDGRIREPDFKTPERKTRPRSRTLEVDQNLPPQSLPTSPAPTRKMYATLPFSFGKRSRLRAYSNPIPRRSRKSSDADSTLSKPTPSRRRSADWSAQRATTGVNQSDDVSWPAQVSREVLRLSFGAGIFAQELQEGPHLDSDRLPNLEPSPDANGLAPSGSDNNALTRAGNLGLAAFFPPAVSNASPLHYTLLGSPFLLQDDSNNLSQSHDNHDHFTPAGAGEDIYMEGELHNSKITPQIGSKQGSAVETGTQSAKPPPSPPIIITHASNADAGPSSPTTLDAPDISLTAPTPGTSPKRSISDPLSSGLTVLKVSQKRPASAGAKGKRKSESEGDRPSHDRKRESHRAKFALPTERRVQRTSGESASSSHAPSSFGHKRPRLSGSTPVNSPSQSRSGSVLKQGHPGSSRTSIESRTSRIQPASFSRATSKVASVRSTDKHIRPSESRRSMSQVSIPISALISPHAPSITQSTTYHMRDPRKPKKLQPTGWGLRFHHEESEEHGSPLQAWFFFIGFLLFPIWWIGSFWHVPTTRHLGGSDTEKAVVVDDPQVEHDAKSWRFRCRVMSIISFLTYVPFIVLLVVFIRR